MFLFQGDTCNDLRVNNIQRKIGGSTNAVNIKHSTLLIRNFSLEDTGTYKCVATNHGNLQSESRILITNGKFKHYFQIRQRFE